MPLPIGKRARGHFGLQARAARADRKDRVCFNLCLMESSWLRVLRSARCPDVLVEALRTWGVNSTDIVLACSEDDPAAFLRGILALAASATPPERGWPEFANDHTDPLEYLFELVKAMGY